jgi:hypothetical protein
MTNTAEWFRAWIPARHPRLDAPGTLQHVRGRGIEVTKIIRDDTDREDFLSRLGERFLNLRSGKRLFCQLVMGMRGYPRGEVAWFLGVTTSAVIHAAHSEELPGLQK